MRYFVAIVLFGIFSLVRSDLPWDRLQVTWGKFDNLPLTASAAVSAGYNLIHKCMDGDFLGNLYQVNGDIANMLIYDVNGKLAGVQTGITHTPTTPNQIWWQKISNGTNSYYVITTYFVNPKTICSQPDSRTNPIGDRVAVKQGQKEVYLELPLNESDAVSQGWVIGKCFYTMGQHYWYNISNTMDCDYFFPVFIIYNKGLLTCFGTDVGAGETSPRWEHPGGPELYLFFDSNTLPSCLFDGRKLSTQHMFLTNGYLDFC